MKLRKSIVATGYNGDGEIDDILAWNNLIKK